MSLGAAFLQPMLGRDYIQKILSMGPIRLFPRWETSGVVANELVAGDNGTYARDVALMTVGAGIGGYTAPLFNGINDVVNIYSLALNAVFSGAAGSVLVWSRIPVAGAWTDGIVRNLFQIRVDGDNNLFIAKRNVDNTLLYGYEAGSVTESNANTSMGGNTNWFSVGMTWDKAAEEVRYYVNKSSAGDVDITLGIWAGNLAANTCAIGAGTATAVAPWFGYGGPFALWDRALSPGDMMTAGVE